MTALGSPQQIPHSLQFEDDPLPGYTPLREPHVHLNSILNKSGLPWASLRLLSDAPAGSKSSMYFNNGSVRGSVEVNLDGPQTLRSIVIEIKARLCLATAHGQPLLWHERKTIWESGRGYDPPLITSSGSWKWDFNIPIPRHFDDSPNGGSKSTLLPGSFDLKPYLAYLEYHAFLHVKKGKWLPTEYEVHSQFLYVVRERTPPPSPLRELAYSEQRAPPGPLNDPNGWEACSEIIAAGTIFGDRKVNVIYKPYLSKPSIYSRGGTIFYHIEILGEDPQALQLMSSPSAINISLIQQIRSSPFGRSLEKAAGKKQAVVNEWPVANGVSWTKNSAEVPSEGSHVVEGEISVPTKANLDLTLSALDLRYFVAFGVNAAGFAPTNPSLMDIKHPVRIVTHPALGPSPTSRIPPGYEPAPVLPRNEIVLTSQLDGPM